MTITVTLPSQDRRLPLAVTRVHSEELPAPDQQSLQDLLAPVPGLFSLNRNNAAQGLRLSIRGFGSRAAFGVRGVQVLLDGVPMTLPDGQTELDALDLDQVRSVRVVRGPAATLFGNAAGGALLLESHSPPTEDQVNLDLQASRFGGRRVRLSAGGSGLQGAALANRLDGYRRHARTASELVNVHWSLQSDAVHFSTRLSALDIRADDPGGLTGAQVSADRRAAHPRNLQFDAGERIRQQRVSLRLAFWPTDWALTTTIFGGRRDFANRLPFLDGGQVRFQRYFAGVGVDASRHWGTHQISIGMDAQLQRDDRQRFDNNNGARGDQTLDQLERAHSVGVFLRDTVALAQHWEASVGVRRNQLRLDVEDDYPADGDQSGGRRIRDWSADASLAHWLGEQYVFARIASSFETPTINELANPAGGGFNPSLSSAQALNRELGIKGDWRGVGYSATLYRIDVRDELLPFQLAAQPGRTFYRNAGETVRKGLELTAHWKPTVRWRLDASLNAARYRFEGGGLDGNRLPGLPERSARLAAQYQRATVRTALIGRHVGRMFADDANMTAVDDYFLLDLQTEWRPGARARVRLGVDNLLDRDYFDNIRINTFGGRYFEPAAGRTYRLSIRFEL